MGSQMPVLFLWTQHNNHHHHNHNYYHNHRPAPRIGGVIINNTKQNKTKPQPQSQHLVDANFIKILFLSLSIMWTALKNI